jgi:hypothetical protein
VRTILIILGIWLLINVLFVGVRAFLCGYRVRPRNDPQRAAPITKIADAIRRAFRKRPPAE